MGELEATGRVPLADLMARRRALLDEVAAITSEVRRRGLARTDNLVGELGERLALMVLGGKLAPPSTKSIDLVDALGRQVQVKARDLPRGDQRLFQFSSLDFDVALCLRFDRATFTLDWARLLTAEQAREIATSHAAGPRITGARMRDAGTDMSAEVRAAWVRLQRAQ